MLVSIGISLFFIAFGLYGLLFKPYFHLNEKVHLKKVTNAIALSLILLGLLTDISYLYLKSVDRTGLFPLVLLAMTGIFAFLANRFPYWYTYHDSARHAGYNREVYLHNMLRARKHVFVVAFLVMLAFGSILLWMPHKSLEGGVLKINGIYGLTKKMDQIIVLDTVSQLPQIRKTKDGISIAGRHKGEFVLRDMGDALLFVYEAKPPFIFVEYKRSRYLYFNLNDPDKTREFYRQFRVIKDDGALH